MPVLSSFNRNAFIEAASNQVFDIIIIGGGITGAGIALDAATRGMKVLLLEKNDFASGTSSKSTKLIHGGLRYLKQMEFALVRDVGRERAVIHKIAPHLVKPINMVLPVYENGSLGRISTAMALWIYDHLAQVQKEDAFRMLSRDEMIALEPLLNQTGLKGGAVYTEYRTDDARLTIEVIKTATANGAICLNYAACESLLSDDSGLLNGVVFRDNIQNRMISVKANIIINAAGPWVDDVRKLDGPVKGKKLHLTKGIHIVVNHEKLQVQHALYFDVENDSRMIFVIPRNGIVYIGTTDTNFTGDKDAISITKEEVNYLLTAVKAMFPENVLGVEDIISSWAGLRPLIHEEGKSPSELSRKDEIFVAASGLLSIAGGKLTGYRKMATKVVNIAAKKLQEKYATFFAASRTESIMLCGSEYQMTTAEYLAHLTKYANAIGAETATIERLITTYGAGAEGILKIAVQQDTANAANRLLYAEIRYTIENEMVCTTCDFLIRRTGLLYLDRAAAAKMYPEVTRIISELTGLTDQATLEQLFTFEQLLNSTVSFT